MKKGNGISYGATVLALSNILVKCIGLFFKIPLANLSGATALAYFNMAMSVFSFGMIAVTAGLPTAAARLIAASPKGYRQRVSVAALIPALIFGAISSVLIYLAAPKLALIAGSAACAPAIRAIAPGIFACCAVSVLRALRQGEGDMHPTAASQLIEAVVRLTVGLSLGRKLVWRGPDMVAAGAAIGVAAGEFCALICLAPMIFRMRLRPVRSNMRTVTDLARVALPLTAGSLIHTVLNILDTRILLSALRISGLTASSATEIYGIYSGYCMTLISFPPTVIAALSTAVLPAVAAMYAVKNREEIVRIAERSLRTALFIAAPCAAGFISIPRELLSLLFHRAEDVATAAPLLAALSPSIVLLAVSAICRTLLIACGMTVRSVVSSLVSSSVRILVIAVAARIPGVGIFGAALASCAAILSQVVIDFISLRRLGIVSFRIRPLMPPVLLSLPILVLSPCTYRLLSMDIAPDMATVLAVGVSATVYLTFSTLFGFLKPTALFRRKSKRTQILKKC